MISTTRYRQLCSCTASVLLILFLSGCGRSDAASLPVTVSPTLLVTQTAIAPTFSAAPSVPSITDTTLPTADTSSAAYPPPGSATPTIPISPAVKNTPAPAPPTSIPTMPIVPEIPSPLTPQILQAYGWTFVPADATTSAQVPVSRSAAIKIALKTDLGWYPATGVAPILGYLDNPVLKVMAAKGEKVMPELAGTELVWVVSLNGVTSIPNAGAPPLNGTPSDSTPVRPVSNVLNVVINAKTGTKVAEFTS